jgi:hypothetical protein
MGPLAREIEWDPTSNAGVTSVAGFGLADHGLALAFRRLRSPDGGADLLAAMHESPTSV